MKKLQRIHQSSEMHWVGDGFPVRSVFGYNDLGRELSPFLLLDYAAPTEFPPGNEKRGVGAHPHKGFETVTVAYQDELEHRDSSAGCRHTAGHRRGLRWAERPGENLHANQSVGRESPGERVSGA